MDKDEFVKVVTAERLQRWLWMDEPRGTSADKVCVWSSDDGVWRTAITDERAGIVETTRRSFETESDALSDALEQLRMLQTLQSL